MLDIIKALLALRLGVMFVLVVAVLTLLGVSTIAHGSVGAGVLVLAAVAVCMSAAALLVARAATGRK